MSDKLLKIGDKLTYGGFGCRVAYLEEGFARIVNTDGDHCVIQNPAPENFVSGPQFHCGELTELLAANADRRQEYEQPISEEEKQEAMSTKTKQSFAKVPKPSNPRGGLAVQVAESIAAKKPAAPEPEVKAEPSDNPHARNGRAAFTRSLAHDKSLSVEEIHRQSKEKFPNSDLTTTKRIVESERAKL